jgi:hypothetical protein
MFLDSILISSHSCSTTRTYYSTTRNGRTHWQKRAVKQPKSNGSSFYHLAPLFWLNLSELCLIVPEFRLNEQKDKLNANIVESKLGPRFAELRIRTVERNEGPGLKVFQSLCKTTITCRYLIIYWLFLAIRYENMYFYQVF